VTLENAATRRSRRFDAFPLGWILALAALGWAFAVYRGVGPVPMGGPRSWLEPGGWLLDQVAATSLGAWLDTPRRGLVAFSLPALTLAAAVFATTRSALARTLAVGSLLAVALFLFYGLGGSRATIWAFFGWRGSAVIALFALVMGAALCAPFLGASWLRRGWPLRLALYLPLLVGVVVALRDVTGTDPKLAFAISPWPVVTMFGIEIGASLVVSVLAAGALLLALAASSRLAPGRRAVAIGLALGTLVALGILLRPQPGIALAVIACAVALAALGALAGLAPDRRDGLASAARGSAVGSILVALPVSVGLAWVDHDYTATRDGAAKQINEALQRYFERQSGYPDALEELVASKDLAAVPVPQVGFGVDGAPAFTYENFGTSYLLEFSAPRWVQCAYNPPWSEEELEEPEEVTPASGAAEGAPGEALASNDDQGGDAMPGSWSCPRKPPELW